MQIVPSEPSFGQQFGNTLATGLGSGLSKLATQGIGAGLGALGGAIGKATGITPTLTKKQLLKAGFSESDADIILSMPEKDRVKMLELLSSRAPEEQPQPDSKQTPRGAPDENLRSDSEASTEVPQTPQENAEEDRPISPGFMKDYKDITGKDFESTLPGNGSSEEAKPFVESKVIQSTPRPKKESALFRPTIQQKRQEEARTREEKKMFLAEDKLRFQKEQAVKKENRELSKEERKEQHYVDQETKPFYEKTNETYKEARKSDMRTSRMNELIDSGELTGPKWNTFLSFLEGKPFGNHGPHMPSMDALRSASDIEFNKIAKDFLKGAKAIFGSRVTEGEIRLFLQTVPDLNQTDEGKKRIIHNMELFSKAIRVEYDIMNEIIEENGGNRPKNLEALVRKKADPILDKLADEFKMGYQKPMEFRSGEHERPTGQPISELVVNKLFGQ